MDDAAEEKVSGPRPPSFLDALAPVLVLIGLLTLTIVLFGTAAADGPLQVALFTSAVFAGLVAFKNGYTAANLREAAIGGISSAMGALFILLAVGALIGTWNMAGTIPTVVSYGIAHPQAGDLLRRRRPDLRASWVPSPEAPGRRPAHSAWPSSAWHRSSDCRPPSPPARSSPGPTWATRCRRSRRPPCSCPAWSGA